MIRISPRRVLLVQAWVLSLWVEAWGWTPGGVTALDYIAQAWQPATGDQQ